MFRACSQCGVTYDDVSHDTQCPHDWFPTTTMPDRVCSCPHDHPDDQRAANREFTSIIDEWREAVMRRIDANE